MHFRMQTAGGQKGACWVEDAYLQFIGARVTGRLRAPETPDAGEGTWFWWTVEGAAPTLPLPPFFLFLEFPSSCSSFAVLLAIWVVSGCPAICCKNGWLIECQGAS